MEKEEIKTLSNNKEVITLFSNEGRHRDGKNETIFVWLAKQRFYQFNLLNYAFNYSVIHNKVDLKVRF